MYVPLQESKRSFLHSVVNEGGDKEKLEFFVNFCEDTIFEVVRSNPFRLLLLLFIDDICLLIEKDEFLSNNFKTNPDATWSVNKL